MKFRFLDRIVSFEPDGRGKMVTSKTFPRTEDYLDGPFHAPGTIPGSLILETMASSAGRLIHEASRSRAFALIAKVEEARFLLPVMAGEEIFVRSELLAMQDPSGEAVGLARSLSRALAGEKIVAEARIVFLCVPADGFPIEDSLGVDAPE